MALTPEEQARLRELEGRAAPTGLSAAEARRLAELEAMDPGISTTKPLDTVGEGYMRLVDTLSGAGPTRTALGLISGQLRAQDVWDTLKGKAPTLGVYAERAGVPKGPSLADTGQVMPGAWNDVSVRGALTGAGDILASPGALLSRVKALRAAQPTPQTAMALRQAAAEAERQAVLKKAAPVYEKLFSAGKGLVQALPGEQVLGKTAEKAGAQIYRGAPLLRAADQALAKVGKPPLSTLAMEAGAKGTPATINAKLEKELEKLKAASGKIEADPRVSGSLLDSKEVLEPALDLAREKAASYNTPISRPATAMEEELNRVVDKTKNGWDWNDAKSFKQENQQLVYPKIQSPDPELPVQLAIRKQAADSVMGAMENTADSAQKGLGGKLHTINQKQSQILNSREARELLQRQAERRSWLPSPGEGSLGLGAFALNAGDSVENTAAALGVALGSKAIRSTAGRTHIGSLLHRLGQSGVLDPITRKALLERYGNHSSSPWSLLKKEDEK